MRILNALFFDEYVRRGTSRYFWLFVMLGAFVLAMSAVPVSTPNLAHAQANTCSGKTVSATPATLQSVINANDNATIQLSPGTYASDGNIVSVEDKQCLELRCTQSANSGTGSNKNGCVFKNQIFVDDSKNIVIENMVFNIDNTNRSNRNWDYGVRVYDTHAIRIANNVFTNNNNYDISTKVHVEYAEVLNNVFISCTRHCIEIGQNWNIPSRPTTSGHDGHPRKYIW